MRRTHTTLRIRLTVFVWASFFCRAAARAAPALSLRTSAHTGVAIRFLSPSNAAGRCRNRRATKGRPYGMGRASAQDGRRSPQRRPLAGEIRAEPPSNARRYGRGRVFGGRPKVAPTLSLRTSAHTGVAIRFLSPSNAAGRSRIRLATKGRPYGMGPSVGARRTAVPVAPTIGRRNPRRAAEQCSALRGADAYSAGDHRSPLREKSAFLRPHSKFRTPNSASVSLFRSLRRSMPSWS